MIRLAGPFQNLVLPLPLCMSLDESLPLSELQLCPLQTWSGGRTGHLL